MRTIGKQVSAASVVANPSLQELRQLASHDELTTVYGSAVYHSQVRNRSAGKTFVVEEGQPLGVHQQGISLEAAGDIADRVQAYLQDKALIRVDRTMCQHPDHMLTCRLYVTRPYARLAHMWHNTLFPPQLDATPDFVSVYVPEWPERIIFVYPESGISYILGTDYMGEAKKSFLRMAMYAAKRKHQELGLHAGSKLMRVRRGDGLAEVGFLIFGLSGTGKTTLTIHDHGLDGDEGIVIRQDDVVLLNDEGYCYGTENGFYLKTEGLEPSQENLFRAATQPSATFENVAVGPNGELDFLNQELTSNGRGVVLRSDVDHTDDTIDLPKAHKLLFITRREDIVPPVARLTPEQAAAFFMLGESVETSAGDPTKAGQSIREVGTNPFMIGAEEDEGNRLLEILRANPDMESYLLNTGSVGAGSSSGSKKVTIQVSTDIMKQIAIGGIHWERDPDWGYEVPVSMDGVDLAAYRPQSYYTPERYQELTAKLRAERREWLAQFPDLDDEIPASIGG